MVFTKHLYHFILVFKNDRRDDHTADDHDDDDEDDERPHHGVGLEQTRGRVDARVAAARARPAPVAGRHVGRVGQVDVRVDLGAHVRPHRGRRVREVVAVLAKTAVRAALEALAHQSDTLE